MTCTKHKSIKPVKHYAEGTKSEQFYRGQRSHQQSVSTYTALKLSSAETERQHPVFTSKKHTYTVAIQDSRDVVDLFNDELRDLAWVGLNCFCHERRFLSNKLV